MAGSRLTSPGRPGAGELITEINVTPLVDVILVVLILFMATARLMPSAAIAVDPPAAASARTAPPRELVLAIRADGTVVVAGAPLRDGQAIREAIARSVHQLQPTGALVAADRRVPHERVIEILDLLQLAGVRSLGLSVTPR
jgi:biopolymer transport protein ExbD